MATLGTVGNLVKRIYRVGNRVIHSRGSKFTVVAADDAGMVPQAIHPPDIIEGDPKCRFKALNESGDGGMATGMWDCTAGRFRWVFHMDEVVHVIEGEVFVTVAGETQRIGVGDVAFFPIGTDSEWRVPEYVKKIYFHRHPMPVVNRALSQWDTMATDTRPAALAETRLR
jgi:uncharacterized protein